MQALAWPVVQYLLNIYSRNWTCLLFPTPREGSNGQLGGVEMSSSRKRHSRDFKLEVIRRVQEIGRREHPNETRFTWPG